MDRTTVKLPPRLKQELLDAARREGVSFGELVRRTLERDIRHPISGAAMFEPPRRARKQARASSDEHPPPPLVHQTALGSATRDYLDVADLYDIYI